MATVDKITNVQKTVQLEDGINLHLKDVFMENFWNDVIQIYFGYTRNATREFDRIVHLANMKHKKLTSKPGKASRILDAAR